MTRRLAFLQYPTKILRKAISVDERRCALEQRGASIHPDSGLVQTGSRRLK